MQLSRTKFWSFKIQLSNQNRFIKRKKLHPKFPLKTVSSPDKPKTEWLNPVRTLEPANIVKTKIFTQKKAIKSQGRRAPQKIIVQPQKTATEKIVPSLACTLVCNLRPANPDVKDGVCCPAAQLPIKKPMSNLSKWLVKNQSWAGQQTPSSRF